MNICTECDQDFVTVTAFDEHRPEFMPTALRKDWTRNRRSRTGGAASVSMSLWFWLDAPG